MIGVNVRLCSLRGHGAEVGRRRTGGMVLFGSRRAAIERNVEVGDLAVAALRAILRGYTSESEAW